MISLILVIVRAPKSLKVIIANEVNNDDFKLVVRRIIWLFKFGYVRVTFFTDNYFDMSIGLDLDSSLELYSKLERYQSWESEFEKQITLAQMASAVLESQISPGESLSLSQLRHQEYDQKFCDHLSKAQLEVKKAVSKTSVIEDDKYDTAVRKRFGTGRKLKINLMQKHAEEIFRQVVSFTEQEGARIFAIGGTLLGIVRENGFIEHDYDIDFGVFADEITDEFLQNLTQLHNFKPAKSDFPCFRKELLGEIVYSRYELPALIKLIHSSGVQVDIFLHFEEDAMYWHGSSLHRWENNKFELKFREFLGVNVYTPVETDHYLTEHYGDWRTPVSEFNCSTGTPNIVISDSCKTKCFFAKKDYYAIG